jgi:hypothetical protein
MFCGYKLKTLGSGDSNVAVAHLFENGASLKKSANLMVWAMANIW